MARDDIARALGRWPEIAAERQALLDAWPDEPAGIIDLAMDGDVRLTVVCGPALASVSTSPETFDAWYLDGFAPSRNGDMWSEGLMQAVWDHTAEGGTFATYAAAGFVRRSLIAAGFSVERRPGFAGKREMLCGTKTPAPVKSAGTRNP
jgi:tRNA U34 5-methylaminomethyl-2-thiouridine-forming methyltransferase MnmC